MADSEIFDRNLTTIRRERAARSGREDFVRAHIADELLQRLDLVTRPFADALELGASDEVIAGRLRARGLAVTMASGEADRLPFAPGSFDLIVSAGGLDMVNDLPGALTLIRRSLRPDGLFLGGFVGAGSLPRLRAAMLTADLAGPGEAASPRIHPQIDVRAMGDLLQRAGFALPVSDGERLSVRYAGLPPLIADIRAAGAANTLLQRDRRPLTRYQYAAAQAAFAAAADPDGRVTERLELVYCLGWAPADSQPRPARRGSGVRSLADALRSPGGEAR